jgi:drug/metabolite transporter (DMT)-like permease
LNIWFYILLAFLGGVSFGVPASFVKLAYGSGFSTADVVGAQFFFGASILWVIGVLRGKISIPFSTIIKLLLAGVPMALTTLFYYHSLHYLDASIAIIMLFQFTWLGVLGEWIIDKIRPTRGKILAIIFLFVGSLLAVNVISSPLHTIPIQGVLWGLLAAVSFTVFIFVSGRVSVHIDPLKKSLFMATGAFLVSLFIYPPLFLINGSMTGDFLIWGLILGLFGVALPPFLYSISLPHMSSGLGTILSASELPTSVILSMIILGEHVSSIQWSGIVIILFAMILPSLVSAYSKIKKFSKG